MMNKLFLSLSLLGSTIVFGQCNIQGKSTIIPNEVSSYSVENDIAQCSDCHLWTTVGSNSQIEGDFKKNTVNIKPLSGGRTVLSLSMLSPQGLVQCSKNIDIIDGNANITSAPSQTSEKVNCDITVNNYKEVKYDTGVVTFFPNNTQNNYKYTWKVSYANGQTRESNDKIPQFIYSDEMNITKVNVKVVSLNCMKEFSKTYDHNYWKFF